MLENFEKLKLEGIEEREKIRNFIKTSDTRRTKRNLRKKI